MTTDANSENVSSSSSSSCTDESLLTASNILSADTLAALLEFQQTGGFTNDENDNENEHFVIDTNAICATFTPGDSQMIAATYRRLQLKEEQAAQTYTLALQNRIMVELPIAPVEERVETLLRNGVVRLKQALSSDTCNACLEQIQQDLTQSDFSEGFGNVFSRNHRYDMYLNNQGIYQNALYELLATNSPLGSLLTTLLNNQPGVFHEYSSLISDPGSDSQPIHPDSPYSTVAPLWTCFVALQDVTTTMGPTVMLPHTHDSKDCHDQLADPTQKDSLLAHLKYHRSVLNKGDCAVMDSRCFHFGDANTSDTRRVLLYLTIRNPAHDGEYPTCGSLFPNMSHLTVGDFL